MFCQIELISWDKRVPKVQLNKPTDTQECSALFKLAAVSDFTRSTCRLFSRTPSEFLQLSHSLLLFHIPSCLNEGKKEQNQSLIPIKAFSNYSAPGFPLRFFFTLRPPWTRLHTQQNFLEILNVCCSNPDLNACLLNNLG